MMTTKYERAIKRAGIACTVKRTPDPEMEDDTIYIDGTDLSVSVPTIHNYDPSLYLYLANGSITILKTGSPADIIGAIRKATK